MTFGAQIGVVRLMQIVVAAGSLAACGVDWSDLPWNQPAPSTQAPAPAPPPAATPRPPPRTAAAPAARPAAPSPPGPAPDLKLVGLSQPETAALLGKPTLEEEAAPAKVWQYRGRDCVLDVYFFLDVSRNGFYALDYRARGDAGAVTSASAPETERCLRRVYDESRQR